MLSLGQDLTEMGLVEKQLDTLNRMRPFLIENIAKLQLIHQSLYEMNSKLESLQSRIQPFVPDSSSSDSEHAHEHENSVAKTTSSSNSNSNLGFLSIRTSGELLQKAAEELMVTLDAWKTKRVHYLKSF